MSKHTFSCRSCGECCGSHIQFTEDIVTRYQHILHDPQAVQVQNQNGSIQVWELDGYCTFLDRNTRKCNIYTDRPLTCRTYGLSDKTPCPYVRPDGTPRSAAEIAAHEAAVRRVIEFIRQRPLMRPK
jgi:Fe-S-cluster containining protein